MNAGWIGCGIGLALGTIDVTAQHYKFYDSPYLTAGMLGYGSISVFQMSTVLTARVSITVFHSIRNAVGFISGAIIASGIINKHLEYVPAPIEGAIYGYACCGLVGFGIGAVSGIVDVSLSRHNVTHKYWLTNGMYGSTVAALSIRMSAPLLKYLPPRAGRILTSSKEILGAAGAFYY